MIQLVTGMIPSSYHTFKTYTSYWNTVFRTNRPSAAAASMFGARHESNRRESHHGARKKTRTGRSSLSTSVSKSSSVISGAQLLASIRSPPPCGFRNGSVETLAQDETVRRASMPRQRETTWGYMYVQHTWGYMYAQHTVLFFHFFFTFFSPHTSTFQVLDKPWSQVSTLLVSCLQFLSRIRFSNPTARRFFIECY